ncbi:MAG: DUF4838 domain-containing protein [Clostridia bacterium]|nr:DUF4838 domain-containing protein [Clostridia bacterium]
MKKILSAVLALVMLFALCSNSLAADLKKDNSYTVGDVDFDGSVNGKDSNLLKSVVSGREIAGLSFDGADITADSSIDAKDSYSLKLIISGAASADEYGEGKSLYKLTVSGNDISEYCIVVPENATREDNAHYAAEMMQKYVEKATGVYLDICYGEGAKTKEYAVVYHMVDEASDLGAELGYDGYKYDITDGDVNIYGTMRGNMYCTYELIERMGFVFYSDDTIFLHERRAVAFDEGEGETYAPSLSFRMVSGIGGEDHFYPQKLNGSQTYANEDNTRFGPLTGPRFINAHSFGYYWRMATGIYTDDDHLYECWKTGEQKQESDYGSTPPWQPCATSNTDYETLMLGLDRTITMIEKRGQKFTANISAMSFSICDNLGGFCACRNCRKIAVNQKEGYSGLYISLTNRAAKDIKDIYPEYPTLKLMSIIYEHTVPATILPEENVIVVFCGQGCNNHTLGSDGCGDNASLANKWHNSTDSEAIRAWAENCHKTGAEFWYWYYPISYMYYVAPTPNVLKLYGDLNYIINECGADGIYFECGSGIAFEELKAHLACEFMYRPHMTYEEYLGHVKEFLYAKYGKGYEYVYEYLLMHCESSEDESCYLNNFSYPDKMYDHEYVAEHYREMRALLERALEMTADADEMRYIKNLIVTCDFVGLSALHESWYVNGENPEEYELLYRNLCKTMEEEGLRMNTFDDENGDPETLDPDDLATAPWYQE